MMHLQLYKKCVALSSIFLLGFLFFAHTKDKRSNIANYVFDKDLTSLDFEYQKLEKVRDESELRAALWFNTERENLINLTKPVIFISLGMNCAAARLFELKGLSEAFFPFDWCVSKFESIYKALATDFQDYLKAENLEVLEHPSNARHRFIYDTAYNITYLHDFTLDGDPLNDYEQVKNKYYRRIDRFYRALTLDKKVYFFRTKITKDETRQLNNLIQEKFPKLNYTLVVINNTNDFKKPWNIKHVKNFFINDYERVIMEINKALLQEWDNILVDLKIIKKKHTPIKPSLTPLQKKRNRINRSAALISSTK